MPRATNPTDHLHRARILISGAAVSLEHILAAQCEAGLIGRYEQQAVWIIGELEHAVAQIKRAGTGFEAQAALARCDADEAEWAEAAE